MELEALTKRRFFLDGKPDTHTDHFVVLAEGKLADLAPKAPVEEGAELMLELVEVDRHDGGCRRRQGRRLRRLRRRRRPSSSARR